MSISQVIHKSCPIMHPNWRPIYGYFYFLVCALAHWVEVPVYRPPIKVDYRMCQSVRSSTSHWSHATLFVSISSNLFGFPFGSSISHCFAQVQCKRSGITRACKKFSVANLLIGKFRHDSTMPFSCERTKLLEWTLANSKVLFLCCVHRPDVFSF